ncbi:hypothetical protein L484_003955 [Morus notabilis]|uniref:Uncharacterized protein n=1 Tax=Morus notabilis TaxID=981085 RepID=W9RUA1_9ROSA|nr:hypothetical protein L484_003955 [Morus notabilis]
MATEENMKRLVIGKKMLEKPVSRLNLETSEFETIEGEGTNAEALTQFAKLLPRKGNTGVQTKESFVIFLYFYRF